MLVTITVAGTVFLFNMNVANAHTIVQLYKSM